MTLVLQILVVLVFVVLAGVNIYIILKKNKDNNYKKVLSPTRLKTIEFMKNLNIKHKPSLEEYSSKNGIIRSKTDIVKRMLALNISSSYAVEMIRTLKDKNIDISVVKQEFLEKHKKTISNFGLQKYFTEEEKTLFLKGFDFSKTENKQLLEKIGWETDAVVILCYALCLVDMPPIPDKKNHANKIVEQLEISENFEEIQNKCQVRQVDQINAWADVFFQLNWASLYYKKRKHKFDFVVDNVLKSALRTFIWLLDEKENDWYKINTEVINQK